MKLDKDSNGTLDKEELLSIPGISLNPLAARLVEVFDEDGDGNIDFREFIDGLSIFSNNASIKDKLKFIFKIYDIDRDGFISNGELFLVLKMMVGKNLEDEQLQQIVDKTIMENDDDEDGMLNLEEFTNLVDHSELLETFTLSLF